jgi:hypothetical protein
VAFFADCNNQAKVLYGLWDYVSYICTTTTTINSKFIHHKPAVDAGLYFNFPFGVGGYSHA